MTNNNKMSLRQKIGLGIVAAGFAGIMYGSTYQYHKNLPLVDTENTIEREILSTLDKKLMAQDTDILGEYSKFTYLYVESLNKKLEEIKNTPEYTAQKQERQKEDDSKPMKFALFLAGISSYLAGLYVYGSGNRKQVQTTSGGN
ncbi:MAG: hypothetical protein AABX39_03225 [Nanoarchaeota archaeon]